MSVCEIYTHMYIDMCTCVQLTHTYMHIHLKCQNRALHVNVMFLFYLLHHV